MFASLIDVPATTTDLAAEDIKADQDTAKDEEKEKDNRGSWWQPAIFST